LKQKLPEELSQKQPLGTEVAVTLPRYRLPAKAAALSHPAGLVIWNKSAGQLVPLALPSANVAVGGLKGAVAAAAPTQHVRSSSVVATPVQGRKAGRFTDAWESSRQICVCTTYTKTNVDGRRSKWGAPAQTGRANSRAAPVLLVLKKKLPPAWNQTQPVGKYETAPLPLYVYALPARRAANWHAASLSILAGPPGQVLVLSSPRTNTTGRLNAGAAAKAAERVGYID
jgi:hypothetical protein